MAVAFVTPIVYSRKQLEKVNSFIRFDSNCVMVVDKARINVGCINAAECQNEFSRVSLM